MRMDTGTHIGIKLPREYYRREKVAEIEIQDGVKLLERITRMK
jgi:hypothetical protein